MNGWFRVWIVAWLLAAGGAWAGGGPLNTLVVVNSASRDSRALGAYYLAQHGIPQDHLCRITVSPRAESVTLEEFERTIRAPILAHLASQGLQGQIHYIVLCMDIPSRVENSNGITAALFYGYKQQPRDGQTPCHIATNSLNQYFGAEMAYTATAGWNQANAPIVFLLTARDLKTAKRVVDRGAAAQGTFADGLFCLAGSADTARNIRHRTFPAVARQFALHGQGERLLAEPTTSPVPPQPVLSYLTGLAHFPSNFIQLVLAPGAIADNLTSCAGQLPTPCNNQSSVWDWMQLGATASYGTVSEPCAYQAKFPDPMLAYWYFRGFTAGEALAMSVRNPYQGIWVGDPLAAPFAAPPVVQITEPAAQAGITGPTNLHLVVAAHERGAPPVYLDLYVDGRHYAPITRPFAAVGNDLEAVIGTNRFVYTVAPGEDLFAAVAGLAWAINARGGGNITAQVRADRLDISVREPLDSDGQPLPCAVGSTAGFSQGVYIGGATGRDRLLVNDGVGRASALFHLGTARAYEVDYPLNLATLAPGMHTLTVVARDGTAVQCQSEVTLPFRTLFAPGRAP